MLSLKSPLLNTLVRRNVVLATSLDLASFATSATTVFVAVKDEKVEFVFDESGNKKLHIIKKHLENVKNRQDGQNSRF